MRYAGKTAFEKATVTHKKSSKVRIHTEALIIPFLFLCFCCFAGCRNNLQNKDIQSAHDLQQIKERGELVVLTLYGSTSYFNYRGQEMGFHYELCEQFANALGVKFRIEIAQNIHELVQKLMAGEGDIIAYNLPVTKEWKDSLLYCGKDAITHQVLVQQGNGKNATLKKVTELVGKDIYVKQGTHYDRLVHLNNELGGGIRIHLVTTDSITTEDLITQVAQGEIPYTIADNDLAKLNKLYYPHLDVSLPISFDQRSSWAVRKDCPQLAIAINKWHEENGTSPAYTTSIKRYFEIGKMTSHFPILSLREGKISHYDSLFKQYSKEINWDWRMLASLAYTESNFDTTLVSWAGAKGLMQLMPTTARVMGVPLGKEQNPEESIKAAVKYISVTDRNFSMITDKKERINFVIASYNAGTGHIYDAMALAEKYGKNKFVWKDNVETFILLKSKEEYFTDSVCKNGYFRGEETYNFVKDVLSRFEFYKGKIKP